MIAKKFILTNEEGLHMRPATVFSKAMALFTSDVNILFGGKKYNAKIVMMLMSACIKRGAEIEMQCEGPDEEAAMKKATELIESGFED